MSWQPAPESLRQLAACLKDSLSGFDKNAQKQAEQMLRQAKSSPDINNYLAYILSSPEPPEGVSFSQSEYHLVRSAAGIMLKNNLKSDWKTVPESSLQLIKLAVPIALQDKNPQIRNFAGNVATEIIQKGGLLGWPELLPQLIDTFGNASGQSSPESQEGAMSAMTKICEDNTRMLIREVNGQRPLNYILPQLIAATKSQLQKVRIGALTAINVFRPRESQAMNNSVDDLLQHLFTLANDDSPDVRRQVCRAFVGLVDRRPEKLVPHMAGLVDYTIRQQRSDDEDLSCEAAEFWLTIGEHEDLWQELRPYIHQIIPLLLEYMVYSGEDIALLGGQSDDDDEEDRAEDIRPAFARKNLTRVLNGDGTMTPDSSKDGYNAVAEMDDDLEDGEIDDDDDDDGDENPDERWTVRKCSAAALDVFARNFGGPVFDFILPYLEQNLKHEDWPQREAAVLALGAVAEGCENAILPHLPLLVPYLISLLTDPEPVIRTITCWTLGRYSGWAAALPEPERERYFLPMMEGILQKMLDRNKKVQEAGASAFAHVEERAGKALIPYTEPIVKQYVICFQKYKDRNMYILYDCVQTLAEQVGPTLATPQIAKPLMEALLTRYNTLHDESREVFPLLECLSYVALAMDTAFAPYAAPIFQRCVNIIHNNLEQSLASVTNTAVEAPNKDFLITSLDLLSAIVQALSPEQASQLVSTSPQPLFELLSFCMEDPTDEVRQSAYALLGDCAKFLFPLLEPHLPKLLPFLIKQLDMDDVLDEHIDTGFDVVNNACWSAGEIAVRYDGMKPFVSQLVAKFVGMMEDHRVPRGLVENAATALGRLGQRNAEDMAPGLGSYARPYLQAMEDVVTMDEKASAMKGFTAVVRQNPLAMEPVLLEYFNTIANYNMELQNPVKQELHSAFQEILSIYKANMPQFTQFISQLDVTSQANLRARYSL